MARYSEELIDEVRNSNDIIDVISQYVVLKRSGRNYFGLCPFHKEKSPSFSVSPDKQIFHCFGCGAGGNVFNFIGKIENINFIESVGLLAERAGITLPSLNDQEDSKLQQLKSKVYEINEIAAQFYHENLYKPTSKLAQEYVKKRKLDNNTLKTFSIGFSGKYNELYMELKSKGYKEEEILASSLVIKNERGTYVDRFRNRLMIPIKDVREKVIAFGGRVLDDSKPKYINSPENIVYHKGRQLFGLNVAKKNPMEKIVIVEGYMDAISLYQRGITNVVASLGTALTEQQGRLLRKYSSQIIIGYDSDGAGQAATMRGLEILQNLGYDVRVLQLDENVKDPDEYVIKFGSGRFNACIDKSISLVEFKVKTLRKNLNIDNASDKIKFLNEVANILSKVDNNIEKEVYIDRISKEYNISKEAIYAQTNKILYANNKGEKILEKPIPIKRHTIEQTEKVTDAVIRREKMIISILLNTDGNAYSKFKDKIKTEDFKVEKNRKIASILYDEFEKGNSNINIIIDNLEDEELTNYISSIMVEDFEIVDTEKAILDILNIYEKEKMIEKKNAILKKLEDSNLTKDEIASLENDLSKIIIQLAKMK